MEITDNLIKIDMLPTGRAQWRTLGTEYSKSFTALKEIIDNSISAAGENYCKVLIKIVSYSNNYKVSIEDNSGGAKDVNQLLTIATESEKKEGKYNIYGLGLKNCLAFFNDDYDNSDWIVQTRTIENMDEDKIIQVRAPYCYTSEYNDRFSHEGMNILSLSNKDFKGEFNEPGTYIEFNTKHDVFNNLDPLRTGAPIKILSTVVSNLRDLFSIFYKDLLKKQKLRIEIMYTENGTNKWNKELCEVKDIPILKSIKKIEESKKTNSGGKMLINAHWLQLNRDETSPFLYAQKRGLLLYVNGILVEPYKWVNELFGGHSEHPSTNNICLVVSVWGDKNSIPELSVSKTKIKENGENTILLFDFLEDACPTEEITNISRTGKSKSEFERRDKRYEGQLTDMLNRGYIKNLSKEKSITVPETNDKLKVDIYYEEVISGKIIIEEFKKEVFKGASNFGQIIVYYEILKHHNPDSIIEIILVAESTNNTTNGLIKFYNNLWDSIGRRDKIEFKTYSQLMIP